MSSVVLPQTDYRAEDDWHRDRLQTDGQVESQLKAELEECQKQLKCAHDTQQEQSNKIQSLRYTCILSNKRQAHLIHYISDTSQHNIQYRAQCLLSVILVELSFVIMIKKEPQTYAIQ